MNNEMYRDILECEPVVFAVGNEYQIFIVFKKDVIVWAQIGDELFFDDSNGILRSNCLVHRIHVPMNVLNAAKEYTVITRV